MDPQKQWVVRPELVILARSKPEETVLSSCKTVTNPIGYDDCYNACRSWTNCGQICQDIVIS